jgi:hypothetical protein
MCRGVVKRGVCRVLGHSFTGSGKNQNAVILSEAKNLSSFFART